MKKITSFNENNCRQVSADLKSELAVLAERYGLTVSTSGGKYTTESFTLKVSLTLDSPDGSAQNQAELDFRANAYRYGLSPADLGRKFSTGNGTYRIVGAKPRNRKYPIIATAERDGRSYKFPAMTVVNGMSKEL